MTVKSVLRTMPYSLIRDTHLYYELAGRGPAVLMLHGIGSNSRSFRHQVAALADRYTCIAWDAPGYARSDDPPRAFTMDDLADYAVGLLDHLAIPRAHVLGTSLGGVIAQALYHRHPERVRSLLLADTNPGSGSLPEPERSRRVQARLDALATQTPRQIAEARAPHVVSPNAPATLVHEVADIMAEIRPLGYRAAAIAMGTTDLSQQLPRISVPALILVGELDTVTPPATAELLARAIPNARLVVIPGAGHLSHQEQPEVFNAAVRAFLDEVESAAAATTSSVSRAIE